MAVVVYVPSRLGEGFFTDLPAPTAGDDAKAITYDHGTGAFVYASASASPGGSTTQVQYNNAGAFGGDAGMTYDAANDRLTVVGGLVAPSMRPASDSTTALQWQNAAGTAFVYGDTSNQRVGIGISAPFSILHVATTTTNPLRLGKSDNNVDKGAYISSTQYNTSGEPEGWQMFGGFASISEHRLMFGGGASALNAASNLRFYTAGNTLLREGVERIRVQSDGNVGISESAPTALLDLAASTTARASSRERAGTVPTTPNDGDRWNDGNVYAVMVNGTNAVNTDGGLSIWMQSSTTARNVGRLLWQYTDKTDATRATRGSLTAFYTTTEHKPVTWGANSGGALLSFYDITTPIARQVLATGAGATPDDIITALQALGLVKQS